MFSNRNALSKVNFLICFRWLISKTSAGALDLFVTASFRFVNYFIFCFLFFFYFVDTRSSRDFASNCPHQHSSSVPSNEAAERATLKVMGDLQSFPQH